MLAIFYVHLLLCQKADDMVEYCCSLLAIFIINLPEIPNKYFLKDPKYDIYWSFLTKLINKILLCQ